MTGQVSGTGRFIDGAEICQFSLPETLAAVGVTYRLIPPGPM